MKNTENQKKTFLFRDQVYIIQDDRDYKINLDTVILASCVDTKNAKTVLEAGCGNGAILLSLAKQNKNCTFFGIDSVASAIELANQNKQVNCLDEHVRFYVHNIDGKVAHDINELSCNQFDIVISNPPFFEKNSKKADGFHRALARKETQASLQQWVKYCQAMTKYKGYIYFLFHTDRWAELVGILYSMDIGEISLMPIWSKKNGKSSRVLVRCRKGVKTASKIYPGVIVHTEEGTYTEFMKKIIEGTEEIKW